MNNTTTFGGGAILLLTVLTWIIVPFPANLIIVGLLTLVSIVAYFALDTFTASYRLHEVMPAATLDIGILVFLLSFLDTASALVIWFGINFIVTGYILRDYRANPPTWAQRFGQFQYVAGGILLTGGILWAITWSILDYTNYDDDVRRWTQDLDSQIAQEERWVFAWYKEDGNIVRYYDVDADVSRSEIFLVANWQDKGESGITRVKAERNFGRYKGNIKISTTKNVPPSQGIVILDETKVSCFDGSVNFGKYQIPVKIYQREADCEI